MKTKFRAWDSDKKEMLMFEDGQFLELTFFSDGGIYLAQKHVPIRNFVLMQYTGQKDRRGVEIYAGDLLRCFSKSGKEIVYEDYEVELPDFYGTIWGDMEAIVEVMGNIHENQK